MTHLRFAWSIHIIAFVMFARTALRLTPLLARTATLRLAPKVVAPQLAAFAPINKQVTSVIARGFASDVSRLKRCPVFVSVPVVFCTVKKINVCCVELW
jgi:hypothetical protein